MATSFLTTLAIAPLLISSAAAKSAATAPLALRDGPLQWGTIGDSWDSGVAYNDDVTYDDNKDKCLRLKDAWGAQMGDDDSWVSNGQQFTFAGCSGAQLANMARSGDSSQMPKISSPTLVTMSAGGNNAGFGGIVDNCIYHADPRVDYGLPFHEDPNGTGGCKTSLANADKYMENQLGTDLKNTIEDIFSDLSNAGQTEFFLYVNSYARFFNDNTTDCNNWSFSPWWGQAYLDPGVATNVQSVSVKVQSGLYTIDNYHLGDGISSNFTVKFVSVDEGFEGGRFCESGHSFNDQWYNDDVLIWNLQYFGSAMNATDDGDTPISAQGASTTDSNGTTYLQPPTGEPYFNVTGGLTAWSGSDGSGSGGGNEVSEGWRLRPFHPKSNGHTKIKDSVIAQLQADNIVPGVAPLSTVAPVSATVTTGAISTTAPVTSTGTSRNGTLTTILRIRSVTTPTPTSIATPIAKRIIHHRRQS